MSRHQNEKQVQSFKNISRYLNNQQMLLYKITLKIYYTLYRPYQCNCGKSYYRPQWLKQHRMECNFVEQHTKLPCAITTATTTTLGKRPKHHHLAQDFEQSFYFDQQRKPSVFGKNISPNGRNKFEENNYVPCHERKEANGSIMIQEKRFRKDSCWGCCRASIYAINENQTLPQQSKTQLLEQKQNEHPIEACISILAKSFQNWTPPVVSPNLFLPLDHLGGSGINKGDIVDPPRLPTFSQWHNTHSCKNEHNLHKFKAQHPCNEDEFHRILSFGRRDNQQSIFHLTSL
ncbi:hypothetical protein FGO68_gene12338 [Halteria grandinella]|uniref:Uncharacterized protein n=1 Tax=Halteria grandinella TaxID=5974 RepID=A0A8J8NWM6_HALGN|nr:hypothetical protein FGO68_gene12338 [Halteria grandinella]